MAKRPKTPKTQPRLVTCASCRHFHLDSSGPSYNSDTHIYFMGICTLGLTPDSPIKQFANRPRICINHKPNI